MAKKYVDDVIEHIESDIEKIQTKPSIYIAYLGSRGALHLCKELINNAIDECVNRNSPGRNISIYIDTADNAVTVTDDGRGIPFDKLETVCSYLQSGSKFFRENGSSAGENGVGLTAVNALSDYFTITSIRDGKKASIRWNKGKIDKALSIKETSKVDQSTVVSFKPSEYFMGACQIPVDELESWIEKISYLIPSDVRINFTCQGNKENSIQKKYRNKNGIEDYLKKLLKKSIIENVRLKKDLNLTEVIQGKTIDRRISLDVAFNYSNDSQDEIVDTFCNYINTVDRGVHYDAVRNAIGQYFSKMTKDSLSERDAKKIDIISNDCYSGLVIVLNLQTTAQPHFTGQVKEKVSNPELFRPIKQLTLEALYNYFHLNPKDLKRICDFIKDNARARIKSLEVRNSVLKGETTNIDEHRIEKFTPANNGKGKYKELFLIEGSSAAGTSRTARDNDTQALYALRGVPLNSYNLGLNDVLNNIEFRDLVKILGCNIGDKFDMSKLKYDKIIIMTDSDTDGFRIASLLSIFFLNHLPKIVKDGRLYKAISPLYSLHDKNNSFILNKQKYVEIFESKIGKNIKIIDTMSERALNAKQLQEFLLINRLYLEELRRVSNQFSIHPNLIEYVICFRNDKDFVKKLRKVFPEINIEGNILSGVYEGKFQNLIIDEIFYKRIGKMDSLIFDVNKGKIFYNLEEFNGVRYESKGTMTIGSVLEYCQKFAPVIKSRYKGLGELDARDLRSTTMNPNTRQLIKLTFHEIEEELEKFKILHGNDSNERKKLMEFFELDREDIDN
jgi:DNA gyrase subunit B